MLPGSWRWGSHPGTRSSSQPRAQAEHRPVPQPWQLPGDKLHMGQAQQEPEQFLLLATGSMKGPQPLGGDRVSVLKCPEHPAPGTPADAGRGAGGAAQWDPVAPQRCVLAVRANPQKPVPVPGAPPGGSQGLGKDQGAEPGPDLCPRGGDEEEEDTSRLIPRVCHHVGASRPPPCSPRA